MGECFPQKVEAAPDGEGGDGGSEAAEAMIVFSDWKLRSTKRGQVRAEA